MYKVLHDFIDIDGIHYQKGDDYPFFMIELDEKHIKYLSTNKNKVGKPLIKKVKVGIDNNDIANSKK